MLSRFLLVVAASAALVYVVTAEGPLAFSHLQDEPQLHRGLLQHQRSEEGSDRSSDPAKITGALALYSLFGIFVFSSISTCVIGIIVTVQWPNPRTCCYRTPHSDIPSSESCGCCALHRLNIGFAVTWLALLVLLVLAFIIYLMAAAAVLAIVHSAIAYRLIRQLKASYAASAQMQMTVALESSRSPPGLVTGIVVERPPPGVAIPGIPVIDIPMTVAIVEAPLQTHVNFIENQRTNADGAATSRPMSAASAVGGASSKTIASQNVPIAPVVDSRFLQAQAQHAQQQAQSPHPDGSPSGGQQQQQQQRGVFAWGSPGASTSGEPRVSGPGIGSGPGPSGSRVDAAAVGEAGSPASGGSRSRVAADPGPATGVPAPVPDLMDMESVRAPGGSRIGPVALESGTALVDPPPLPGSPGGHWR